MSRTRASPSSLKTETMRTKEPHPLSARTIKNSKATWSLSPLRDALQESPPPICSSVSSPLSSSATLSTFKSDSFFSDLPTTELSTPRNQKNDDVNMILGCFKCVTKGTISGFEAKERLENTRDNSRFCHPSFPSNSPKGSCLSKLSMRDTAFSGPIREFDLGWDLSSESKESSVYNEEYEHVVASADQSSCEGSDGEGPRLRTDKLMDRPKPYHEFLDEVKKQELQAEIEAWKRAEHVRLMTKLRNEEAAIDDWEFKKTSKALEDIKKLESKLENQRAKAVENTWKAISRAKEESNRKKIRVRRSIIGKISSVSETYQKASFSTKKFIWQRVSAYCKSMYPRSVRCTALTSEPRPTSGPQRS